MRKPTDLDEVEPGEMTTISSAVRTRTCWSKSLDMRRRVGGWISADAALLLRSDLANAPYRYSNLCGIDHSELIRCERLRVATTANVKPDAGALDPKCRSAATASDYSRRSRRQGAASLF